MIAEEIVAEILRRTDIVELIGTYLPLKAAGRTHKALCPFHTEKTPSFTVNPERQIFHCFGCGEGGDAIAFLIKHERLTFPEAVRTLAERTGVSIPARSLGPSEGEGRLPLLDVQRQALEYFRENLRGQEGLVARKYLAGRGLTPELIERFQLGYALPRWDGLLRALKRRGHPDQLLEAAGLVVARQAGPSRGGGHYDRFRNRLMIPICDVAGRVIGFGGRALDGKEVKYINSPETAVYRKGTHLYLLNLAARAIRARDNALVVEGYFDAIMLHAHGFDNAVAALGTALTNEQARLLGRYGKNVVLLFDPDAPGIEAARRSLGHLINVDLHWRIALLTGGLDPDAFVRTHGAAAFAAALDGSQDLVEFFLDRRVCGLDLADPIQRARAVDALVEVVGAIDNPIRREGYVQRVAQRSGVTDRALLEAVAQQRGRIGRRDAAPTAFAPVASPPSAEEQLIYIGMNYPAWRGRIAAELAPEDFRDPILRRIFADFIQSESSSGLPGNPAIARPLSLQPPEVQQRLSSLWARDPWSLIADEAGESSTGGEGPEALRRTVEDCLARIGKTRATVERQVLRQALEAAERRGDPEQALRLLAAHPSVKRSRDSQ
ncbi:MAG TPA: DNA primase [Candidatus Sulfotelmatobacter sp.]|nr:DNA primase [Candidatus Sulfotelmatobacter sp.]